MGGGKCDVKEKKRKQGEDKLASTGGAAYFRGAFKILFLIRTTQARRRNSSEVLPSVSRLPLVQLTYKRCESSSSQFTVSCTCTSRQLSRWN